MKIAEALSKGLHTVAKDHYREKKRIERNGHRVYRPWRAPRPIVKDAVFKAMPEAISQAGGGALPFTVRQLFYKIRPLIQDEVDRELEYSYFTPPLVTEYEETYGEIPGILYDARGNFREPHTKNVVPLGTSGVGGYTFPEYLFDKVLYVEKEGFHSIFAASRLAERYDLAVMGSKGYAVRAAKDLLARARSKDIAVLVLHDCDHDGYEIARTLAEGTRTRQWHSINIIDIGLTLDDVIEMQLPSERAGRRKSPSWQFTSRLSAGERDFFLNRGLRVELNAMSSDQLISFVEGKLAEHGLDEKVIPPEDVGAEEFMSQSKKHLEAELDKVINRAFKEAFGVSLSSLKKQSFKVLAKGYKVPQGFHARMTKEVNDEDGDYRDQPWRQYVDDRAKSRSDRWARTKTKEAAESILAKLRTSKRNGGSS